MCSLLSSFWVDLDADPVLLGPSAFNLNFSSFSDLPSWTCGVQLCFTILSSSAPHESLCLLCSAWPSTLLPAWWRAQAKVSSSNCTTHHLQHQLQHQRAGIAHHPTSPKPWHCHRNHAFQVHFIGDMNCPIPYPTSHSAIIPPQPGRSWSSTANPMQMSCLHLLLWIARRPQPSDSMWIAIPSHVMWLRLMCTLVACSSPTRLVFDTK